MFTSANRLIEILYGYKASIILMIANRYCVFQHIGSGSLSADQIAEKTGWKQERAAPFLDCLVKMELLNKIDGYFVNSPLADQFLLPDSRSYLGNLVELERHVYLELVTEKRLETALKGGASKFPSVDKGIYMGAMEHGVRFAAINMARAVQKLMCPLSMLDLGGGPGEVAVTFCRIFPELKATIFDLPEMFEYADANIKKNNLAQKICIKSGDCLVDSIGQNYDVAVVSNLLHFFNKPEIKELLVRVKGALNPGGIVVVHDFFVEEEQNSMISSISSLDWLTMGVVFNYSLDEMVSILKDAGFSSVSSKKLSMVPTSMIVAKNDI